MKIVVIDNYDSFTYNLVHLVKTISGLNVDVFRNDEFDIRILEGYDKILLSPGPGIPEEAGLLKEIISEYSDHKSIFGVCLGMQAIGEVFGGKLRNMKDVFHGISTEILIEDRHESIFRDIPSGFEGGRYHSWVVEKNGLPDCIKVTASDNSGDIMAISHVDYDLKGVQFHPESILTPLGSEIMSNWLDMDN